MTLWALLGCGGGTVLLGEPYPGDDDDDSAPVDTLDLPVDAPRDYREPGPHDVAEATGDFDGASCRMRYDRYLPRGVEPEVLVVLAHGFSRSRGDVADHGRHLASWGVAVVAPDLCTSDFWNIDHERNGRDLADLGDELSGGAPTVYVGHSAGGLASLLAAARSGAAIGHLGLDLVDSGGLGADAAPDVEVPAWGLLGEPDPCNESSNALEVYDRVDDGGALRVPGADHCDFEAPTDVLCTALCGGGAAPDDQVRSTIRGMTAAYVLWVSGEDPGAGTWWSQQITSGDVTEL